MKTFKIQFIITAVIILTTSKIYSQTRNFNGDTQIEMNFNAGEDYLRWKKEMDNVLLAAIELHKEDKLFVSNLKRSQKFWEAWKDAEIETFFPEYKDSREFYGSMQPLCKYSKLIDWTEERIKQLEIYSKGVQSDDACSPGRT